MVARVLRLEGEDVTDIRAEVALPCHAVDSEVFFDISKEGRDAARAVCRPCGEAGDCPSRALAFEGRVPAQNRFGVWGGKTPTERWHLALGTA